MEKKTCSGCCYWIFSHTDLRSYCDLTKSKIEMKDCEAYIPIK